MKFYSRASGAGERTRTPDLLITNSAEGDFSAPLSYFGAFPFQNLTAFDPITSTVSTQFFRVWVRLWVRQKDGARKSPRQSQTERSKSAPHNKENAI